MAIVTDQENNSTLGRAGQKASSKAGSAGQHAAAATISGLKVASSHLVATPSGVITKFPTTVTVASPPSNNDNVRIEPHLLQHQQQFFNFKDQPLDLGSNPNRFQHQQLPVFQSSATDHSFELRHHQQQSGLRVLGSNPNQEEGHQQLSADSNMDYAWLEPRHDPIATDTNLAEIDFENFKNEDLAYAFSCGVSTQFFYLFLLDMHVLFRYSC